MRIKNLHIWNFKSLVDFELENLRPFCAFVGPNASGKSNIFEALEFTNYIIRYSNEAPIFFGGSENILTYKRKPSKERDSISFRFLFADNIPLDFLLLVKKDQHGVDSLGSLIHKIGKAELSVTDIRNIDKRNSFISEWVKSSHLYDNDFEQFVDNFSRIFVGKSSLNRIPLSSTKLSADASNLPQIIGPILENEEKRNDFIEWLRILIPEFKNIEVRKSNIDGGYDFFVYEKGSNKPFPRSLISDGTYNILSLMAAVYQSNEPQFLCIEEPENGLHPQAIELLVDFFREKCEEEGHHIWLNTHSPTLVRCMEIEEIILINKIDGATRAKQLTKDDEVDIKTDEAWLSNALGGGVLWSK